jgi:membrane-associated phospholipid phosphatase
MPRSANILATPRKLASDTLASIRADAGLYLFILAYTVCGLAFIRLAGAADRMAYGVYVERWLLLFGFLFPVLVVLADTGRIIHRLDRRRMLALRRVFPAGRISRFIAGIVLLEAMLLFQGTFTSVKNALSVSRGGFPYDQILADVDKALHFGADPWRWLHSVAGYDWVRVALEWNYNMLWFVLCYGALFYVATSVRTENIRLRYLLGFMLVWIIVGNVLAGEFMSAGPAFYGFVTGDESRFAQQLAFLAHGAGAANSAASYQDYLWSLQAIGQPGFGSGISAFPSVHVGLAMLNALFLAERSRRLGIIAFGYVALIIASSVYLGWHYAIDGYAAVAIVLAIHVALRKAFANVGETQPAAAIAPA